MSFSFRSASRNSNPAKYALLLVLAASGLSMPEALGQGIQRRPVARLLSPAPSSNDTRARIVGRSSTESSATGTLPTITGPAFDDASVIERRAFEETNRARIKYGFLPLEWDAQLCLLARAHSQSMAQRGYFDHETPEGLLPKDRARAVGLRFRVLAENIAYNKGYDDPGAFAVERWMLSSGHRANILYIGFQAAAIGSHIAPDGSVYLTQLLISR